MINIYEFKIRGPFKSFRFKLINKQNTIIQWVKHLEKMIAKIIDGMNIQKKSSNDDEKSIHSKSTNAETQPKIYSEKSQSLNDNLTVKSSEYGDEYY